MSTHAVYRIYSEAGAPLYVGTTDRRWWVRVAEQANMHPEIANTAGRVEVTHHATREAAFEVETAEIKRLAPKINTRCQWHESRAFKSGELIALVKSALAEIGEGSSREIAEHMGVPTSTVSPIVHRLRTRGVAETVRVVHDGSAGDGQPRHVVRLVHESTAA